jgi:hypothetical protein
VTVIRNAENLGCAAAWNQGVRAEYPRFRRNTLEAGSVLRKEHDARHLLEVLLSTDGKTP